jgi:hypothetical protein
MLLKKGANGERKVSRCDAFLSIVRRNGEMAVEELANALQQLCRSVQIDFGTR